MTFVGICHDPGSKQRVLQKFIREETGRSLGPCKNVPFNGGQAPACRIFILIHIYIYYYIDEYHQSMLFKLLHILYVMS